MKNLQWERYTCPLRWQIYATVPEIRRHFSRKKRAAIRAGTYAAAPREAAGTFLGAKVRGDVSPKKVTATHRGRRLCNLTTVAKQRAHKETLWYMYDEGARPGGGSPVGDVCVFSSRLLFATALRPRVRFIRPQGTVIHHDALLYNSLRKGSRMFRSCFCQHRVIHESLMMCIFAL